MSKKDEELQYANFFIGWLNETYSFDYETVPNTEENSEVDVFAQSNQHPKLKLQLVTSHGEIMQRAAKNTKNFEKGKDFIVGDVDFKKWLLDIIKKKNNQYPEQVKNELILLIQGHVPTPWPSLIESFRPLSSNYPFKGIYYISLPVSSSHKTEETKNGFVVKLKEIVWKTRDQIPHGAG